MKIKKAAKFIRIAGFILVWTLGICYMIFAIIAVYNISDMTDSIFDSYYSTNSGYTSKIDKDMTDNISDPYYPKNSDYASIVSTVSNVSTISIIISGLLFILLGTALIWLFTLILYSYGKLVENSDKLADNSDKTLQNTTGISKIIDKLLYIQEPEKTQTSDQSLSDE